MESSGLGAGQGKTVNGAEEVIEQEKTVYWDQGRRRCTGSDNLEHASAGK